MVKKLERDESAISIHKHLLKDVPEHEIERLLLKTIPSRYFELNTGLGDFEPEPDLAGQNRLATCFRSAFDLASDSTKTKVTAEFLSILKEEDQYKVFTYETAFFRASDLKYLSSSEAKLVKDHLLSRIEKDISWELVIAIEGLHDFLEARDIVPLVDPLMKASLIKTDRPLKMASRKYLVELWKSLPSGANGLDGLVVRRLDEWIAHFDKNGNIESAQATRDLRDEVVDLPF